MKFISIFIFLVPILARSQQINLHTLVPQGDYDKSRNMSLSWTLGEIFTETVIARNYAVTQGFQQPYFDIIKLHPTADKVIDVSLFPNPTQGWLTLRMAAVKGKYLVEIIDTAGRILSGKWHEDAQVLLDLSGLPSGQYVIRVANSTAKTHATFSVVKF